MCFRPAEAGGSIACPECGTVNPDIAKACIKCKADLSEAIAAARANPPGFTAPGPMMPGASGGAPKPPGKPLGAPIRPKAPGAPDGAPRPPSAPKAPGA